MNLNGLLTSQSVIQRQLWLLNNVPDMTNAEAYDQARKEFYALRHEEDIERRIAKEEAEATGAYFGKSMLEISTELEDNVYEKWRERALKIIITAEQLRDGASVAVDPENSLVPVDDPEIHAQLEGLDSEISQES